MDWEFIVKHLPLYIKGLGLTLRLAFFGIFLSVWIGLLCSLISYFKVKGLKSIVKAYIELSRNTPLLVQLFFLYYGLPKIGLTMKASSCAVIGLGFLGGSYMAEALRSGLEAVSQGQIEAGLSIGLSKTQLIRYVILPQALTVAIPALGANSIFLLKETSVLGAIALADLMFVAKDLIGMYYKTTEALCLLVCFYAMSVLPLSWGFSVLERKVRYGTFGH